MELIKFKQIIEATPAGTEFKYGISAPFSWRGAYDEVCFSVLEKTMTREEILTEIEKAYTEIFFGWKGGEYKYADYALVHFEETARDYSSGSYCAEWIAKIDHLPAATSIEEKLIQLIVNK